MIKYLPCILCILTLQIAKGQQSVSGTVFDKSKTNYVENVRVVSSGGMFAITDSLGKYSILVAETDSLNFIYNNKPTQKFAVKSIANPRQFDVSLHISIQGKYSTLKEVIVYAKSYKQDSIENRQTYADVFSYQKPGIQTSITPGGAVGADVNELINIFRFKRNRNLKSFQQRLEQQEQEKYVGYRFNKLFVKRITGLSGNALDSFMVRYRPSYFFTSNSSEISFNEYVLNAFYRYQIIMPVLFPAKKEENR